jgi:hypothetical protein
LGSPPAALEIRNRNQVTAYQFTRLSCSRRLPRWNSEDGIALFAREAGAPIEQEAGKGYTARDETMAGEIEHGAG